MSDVSGDLQRMFREEADERIERMTRTLLNIERGAAPPAAVDSLFRDAHSIKGVAGLVGYQRAFEVAHAIEDVLQQARAGGVLAPELVAPLLESVDAMRRSVEEGADAPPGAPDPPASEHDALPASPAEPQSTSRSMRVDASRVDALLDTVGETVVHHRRLEHALLRPEATLEEGDALLHRSEVLLEDLQDAVIRLRTLPLASITGPYPRTVRDLAVADRKDVELAQEGMEVQLDRVVLEGAAEAISHLLRNAVAHGIEPPEERTVVGKPPQGRIVLRAQQRGDRVAIEVADDGRGVSPDLLERARRSGSLADVLAHPGRSTADGVTALSGRGVGLDAVRHHVQRVGGELEIQSRPGAGTVVRLLLPVSLVLLHVLLVERDGAVIGMPISALSDVRGSVDRVTLSNRQGLRVDDDVVPLGDLVVALGGAGRPLPPDGPALLLNAGGERIALLCDRILGETRVIVKPLAAVLRSLRTYLGTTILGDGRIALIADPSRLAAPAARPAPVTPVAEARRTPLVLVVDDQFTVRELQRSILEAAGYQVETARDGSEAWERLGGEPRPDLVITDLEMPEMHGLELLAAVRGHTALSELPVVVVTSRAEPEDERRGLEAGADAYIVKERFDQQTLVDTVARLIGP